MKIIPNEQGTPAGKLADAEVIVEAGAGPLSGMKLTGFVVWDVAMEGETRRSFPAVLRGTVNAGAEEAIGTCILDAYNRVQAHG